MLDVKTFLKNSPVEIRLGTWRDIRSEGTLLLWPAIAVCTRDSLGRYPVKDQLMAAHPECNVYASRTRRARCGTVEYYGGDALGGTHVCFVVAQVYSGAPRYDSDTESKRVDWFEMSLELLRSTEHRTIAFEEFMGLPADSRSPWPARLRILKEFAASSGKHLVMYRTAVALPPCGAKSVASRAGAKTKKKV